MNPGGMTASPKAFPPILLGGARSSGSPRAASVLEKIMVQTQGERLADEIRRSADGDPWHGPSFNAAVRGVSARQATRPLVPGGHTIWEIVLHTGCWYAEVLQVVKGQTYRNVPNPEQWPQAGDESPGAWKALVTSVIESGKQLAAAVAPLSDEDLARPIEGREYDLGFLLHGLAQHTAYHSGQIVLLKKMP